MKSDMTSAERNALSLVLETVGEGRTARTYAEFLRIAKKLPGKLEPIVHEVNQLLQQIHDKDPRLSQVECICTFKSGDLKPVYKTFYRTISRETIRKALVKSGMWEIIKTGKIAVLEPSFT